MGILNKLVTNFSPGTAVMEKAWKEIPQTAAKRQPLAMMGDPMSLTYSMGYKDRKTSMTYDILRQVSQQLSIISCIINTRVNQVAAFTSPFRRTRTLGFEVKHKDRDHKLSKSEKRFIQELENFVSFCGKPQDNPYYFGKRDNFDQFTRKVIRDRLIFDAMAWEIVPDRQGGPFEFLALDSSTIRLAVPPHLKQKKLSDREFSNIKPFVTTNDTLESFDYPRTPSTTSDPDDAAAYVQVWQGTIKRAFKLDELAYNISNPRTDIRVNGYGNCLHPDSRVATNIGLIPISELVNEEFKVVINGKELDATAYPSGTKSVYRVVFDDNREILTSKDHRFYVLNEVGEFGWKRLEDISEGEILASDMSLVEGGQRLPSFSYEPTKNQRSQAWKIDDPGEDLWEILGWLVGDGNFRVKDDGYDSKSIALFYNDDELDVMERHLATLHKYDLFPGTYKYESSSVTELKFHHQGFGCWLQDIVGVIPSDRYSKPNCLPSSVFKTTLVKRCAFLRGLFSADGHLGKSDEPYLGCTDKGLLQDTQRVLWSIGLRSRWIHKKTPKQIGEYFDTYDDGKLYVYDKQDFFDKVGFIHRHKQPRLDNYRGTRADTVGESFGRRCAAKLRSVGKVDRRVRGLEESPACWGVTRSWLRDRLPKGCSEYDDLRWHHAKVVKIECLNEEVEMFDLSVSDDFHAFSVDGCVVHNSEIEQLINTITSQLWAEEYNRNFFKQGAAPKGILNIRGDNIPPEQLEAFRRAWTANVSGVENSWRTPVLQSEEIQYVNMQSTNMEMEYSRWMEYLIKIICFTPDTPVVVKGGFYKPISKIVPGEEVFTHTGKLRRVKNVQISKHNDVIYNIRSGEVIRATGNHPFYVASSRIDGTSRKRTFDEPEWKDASELVEGSDYLLVPKKTYQDEGSVHSIDLRKYVDDYKEDSGKIARNANRVSWVPAVLPLTEDVAFMLGLYVSEGNSTDTAIHFTFSSEEKELQDHVMSVFSRLEIHAGKYSTKDSTRCVRVTTRIIAESFGKLFGKRALDKKIPKELFDSPRHIQKSFINGVIAGDGSVPNFKVGSVTCTLASVSDVLLEQLRHMFLQQDIYSRKYSGIESKLSDNLQSRLDINGTQAKKLAVWLSGKKGDALRDRVNNSKNLRSCVYESNSYFMVPISEIWTSHYSGEVYNLEIEDEHTYQVNRFAVHNCGTYLIAPEEIGFSFTAGGMQQPMVETNNEWRLKASKDRGLRPLLKFYADSINRSVIDKIDSNFYIDFVGLDEMTERERIELRQQQAQFFRTVNEIRIDEDLDPLDDGDIVLNPAYLQYIQMKHQWKTEKRQMQMQEQQMKQQQQMQQKQMQMQEQAAQGQMGGGPSGPPPQEGQPAPEAQAPPEGEQSPEQGTEAPPEGQPAPEVQAPPEGQPAPEVQAPPEGQPAPEAQAPPEGEQQTTSPEDEVTKEDIDRILAKAPPHALKELLDE